MEQTKMMKVFNDEEFPVGTCVRVSKHIDNVYDPISIDGFIYRYFSMGTVMEIAYRDPVGNQIGYHKFNVEDLNEKYTITKLVPEDSVEKQEQFTEQEIHSEFDPDIFIPGRAVHVIIHEESLNHKSYRHLYNGTNGILRGIQDNNMMCIAVYHPKTNSVYDIMVTAKDYVYGKTEIIFLDNDEKGDNNES